MRKLVLFLLLNLSVDFSSAQNLIPNSSFEEIKGCPYTITSLRFAIPLKYWYSPTQGTPDLFHRCSEDINSIPRNFMGDSYPHNGEVYAGLCMFKVPEKSYREYLAVKLQNPLDSAVEYSFSFFYRLSSLSKLEIDRFQILFTSEPLSLKANTNIEIGDGAVLHVAPGPQAGLKDWELYSEKFIAMGGEEYLVIGNFSHPDSVKYNTLNDRKYPRVGRIEKVAYYYIDSFELIRVHNEDSKFEKEVVFQLKNLYFDFDKYQIKEEMLPELKELAEFMMKQLDLKLIINGHTDNVGSEQYNNELSLKRAIAVKDAIVFFGVAESQISTESHGKRFLTSKLDSLNRRVEFILLEQRE